MQRYLFRATERKKQSIADNIVGFMNDTCELSKESYGFILDWIMTGCDEKTKAYFDIWNKILDDYLPTERPVLFRSCLRVTNDPIQSFTGSIHAAERFSEGHKGHILVCDTEEYMNYLTYYKENEEKPIYKRNFFPIYDLIRKDLSSCNPKFREKFYARYSGEDEYIVRVDKSYLYDLKWSRKEE